MWDKLIPQCLITLNLLRRSRINPQLSSQAQINGAFDFNRTPLAPPGTKVLIHEKTSTRGMWAPHVVEGWYLGPAQRHYRCYRVWAWATNSEHIADTLAWFPTTIIMPRHSSTDIAIAAAHDLARALLLPPPSSPPVPHLRQPASPTTPTQQHLPPTHIATRQHTSPTNTTDDNNINTAATRCLFPSSNHLSLSTPFTEQLYYHPIITSEGGARYNEYAETNHMGSLRHRWHRYHRHIPIRHDQPRSTSPLRHERSKECR
jgi:hypothetical protein